MKKLTDAIRDIKEEMRGAACFYDPATKKHRCYNNLTHEEAKKAARESGVKLNIWTAGASCKEITCGP